MQGLLFSWSFILFITCSTNYTVHEYSLDSSISLLDKYFFIYVIISTRSTTQGFSINLTKSIVLPPAPRMQHVSRRARVCV